MLKRLSVLAVLANAFFLASSTESVQGSSYSSSRSSNSQSFSDSESYSSSIDEISPTGPCSHGHEYQQISSSSVSSSSSSSSAFSSSTSCGGSHAHSIHHPDCRSCRKNERWVVCPEAVCVPKTCDDVGLPIPCYDSPPNDECPGKSGCICEEGLVRNEEGYCVPIEQCPPKCGDNEYLSDCIQSDCSPQNCSQLGFSITCARIDPMYCEEGCLCNEGFVRNNEGMCIPKTKCPSCGGDEHKRAGCGGYCNRRCSDIGKEAQACSLICEINGCDCEDGYYYDDNTGLCVTKEQCTPTCGLYEENNDCVNANCAPITCDDLGFPIACVDINPTDCQKGCQCQSGYVRNNQSVCIPATDCPSCGGDKHKRGGCGGYCNRRCSDIGKEAQACPLVCEINGCDCEDGYYYDDNTGLCVTEEQCTPTCGKYEEYNDCVNGNCAPRTCDDLGFPIACGDINPTDCQKGCQCQSGYVRNNQSVCIPATDCPSCGGDEFARSGCSANCNKKCSDVGKKPGVCVFFCILNGCECIDNYFYDSNLGKCVEAKDCTPICLDENNEVFSNCTNGGCQARNCSQYGKPVPCIKINPKYCKTGCVCKDGYLRAKNGQCVLEKNCPDKTCPGQNEEYHKCTWDCPPQTCDTIGKIFSCPAQSEDNCKEMCKCKSGYYRNKDGICVTEAECKKTCPGQNEEYLECTWDCPPQTCDTIGENFHCPLQSEDNCKEMCKCKSGYYRNKNGICVTEAECKKTCPGQNEEYLECTWDCPPQTCDTIREKFYCPLQSEDNCKEMCKCKSGYYRNKDGICVTEAECTPICLAKNYEVYSNCTNVGCTWRNCTQYGKPVSCMKIDAKDCITGCVCIDGYLRADNGKCIPEKDCPEACIGPNEQHYECAFDCPPQTCDDVDKAYACPIKEGEECRPMCKCKPGCFRNKIGQCITDKQCRQCPGPQYYSCGGACDNVCATLHKQNQTNCPIINIKCTDMCYCQQGYARARNNTCIPIKRCKEPQCPIYERWEKCPGADCEPHHCSQLGYPIPCPDTVPDNWCPYKPACVCVEGYVRNYKGKCIPKQECGSCGGDCHARPGCGVNCGKHCRDLGRNEETFCIDICYRNSCECEDGYYLDSIQKKCVKPEQCTDICGTNEVYEDCSDYICRVQNCTQLGFPLDCNNTCKKGCVCRDGYARDYRRICIPVKQCPSCGGDDRAETGCGTNCLKKCYDLLNPDHPRPCPKICKVDACECKHGSYFDEIINKCVLPGDCSPICGKDEIYSPCVNGERDLKYCHQLGDSQICMDVGRCIPGCNCREGYLRNNNGTCVPFDQCPIPKCKENERFSLCPAKECLPQTCKEVGFPVKCLSPDEECPVYPACICSIGYLRNDKGICRPNTECTSCGGDCHARPGCGFNCLSRCPNNYINPKFCPRIVCLGDKCDCKPGFYYDINTKMCVTLDQCSPRCDDQNHEVYNSCVNGGCDWKNCSEVGGPKRCIDPITCKQGCSCEQGFYRLNNGTCVPADQCPLNCWKTNEIYDPCPPICPPQTCKSLGEKFFCPRQNATGCKEQCRCKPGFYRNLIGECICKKNCLKCKQKHEYYSCGPPCDNVCGKLHIENKTNCLNKCKKCVPRCYCEDGYARNGSGICIPINKCPGQGVNATEAIAKFQTGNQAVGAEFAYQLLLSRPNENFMVSAFSALLALAQLALKAIGLAYEQFMHLLNLTKDEIITIIPILINDYKSQQDVIIEIFMKYYSNDNSPFSEEFIRQFQTIFSAQSQSLDFSQREESANTINQWVSSSTNGLIKNLVSADMFSALTRCVLVNALYFKGNWSLPFNANLTESRPFYINNDTSVQMKTMYQKGKFKYGESDYLNCQMLDIPYKNKNFTFLIMLPKLRTGLSDLIEKLTKPQVFDDAIAPMTTESCEVYVPSLEISTVIDNLSELLQKLNVTEAFNANSDNFEGIFENNETKLYISNAIQKTYLIVSEEGTEAAAATAITLMTRTLASKNYIFNAFVLLHSL